MKHFINGTKYRKIQVNSANTKLYINCIRDPEFLYNFDDTKLDIYCNMNIRQKELKVTKISMNKLTKNICTTHITDFGEQGIILNPEFSNLYDSYIMPSSFMRYIIDEWKVEDCVIDVCSQFNYFAFFVNNDGYSRADFCITGNFVDFANLQKYDFEFTSKIFNEYSGKLIFDGESLRSEYFIIRFIKKPKVEPFEIKLDNIINNINCSFLKDNDDNIIWINPLNYDGKLSIDFRPKELDDIVYLRLLSDLSKFDADKHGFDRHSLIKVLYNI